MNNLHTIPSLIDMLLSYEKIVCMLMYMVNMSTGNHYTCFHSFTLVCSCALPCLCMYICFVNTSSKLSLIVNMQNLLWRHRLLRLVLCLAWPSPLHQLGQSPSQAVWSPGVSQKYFKVWPNNFVLGPHRYGRENNIWVQCMFLTRAPHSVAELVSSCSQAGDQLWLHLRLALNL
jgi:hypothetical protein